MAVYRRMNAQTPAAYKTPLENTLVVLGHVSTLVRGAIARGVTDGDIEQELLNREDLASLRTSSFQWLVQREFGIEEALTAENMAKRLIVRAHRTLAADRRHAEEEGLKRKHDGQPNPLKPSHVKEVSTRAQGALEDYDEWLQTTAHVADDNGVVLGKYAEWLLNTPDFDEARVLHAGQLRQLMDMEGQGPVTRAELTTALMAAHRPFTKDDPWAPSTGMLDTPIR